MQWHGIYTDQYMVNGLHLYSTFIQSTLQLPHIHPFIHRRWCQPCKVTTNTSGGEVRVRWCLAQGARGSNQQLSGFQTTALTSWATAAQYCWLCYLADRAKHPWFQHGMDWTQSWAFFTPMVSKQSSGTDIHSYPWNTKGLLAFGNDLNTKGEGRM